MDILTPTLPVIVWLQSFPAWRWPMQLLSLLGSTYFYLAALPLLYWCYNRRAGLELGFLLLANAIINNLAKVFFASPRPYWVSSAVHQWTQESSFGLPSGHTQGAIVFWFFLAWLVPRRQRKVALVVAGCITALIAVSRMYLAAHFLADVLAGALLGALLLLLYLKFTGAVRAWLYQRQLQEILILIIALVAIPLSCFALFLHFRQTSHFPLFDAAARSWAHIISYCGALLGLSVGTLLQRSAPAAASKPNRILRILAGMIVLAVLWLSLAMIPTGDALPAQLILRFCRFALVAWWITDGAPRLFARWENRIAV